MNKSSITLKELKQRSLDRPRPLQEDVTGLNKAFLKFRSIYQSGKRFSGKEWIKLMADLLDEID